jgi:hypothetical protein
MATHVKFCDVQRRVRSLPRAVTIEREVRLYKSNDLTGLSHFCSRGPRHWRSGRGIGFVTLPEIEESRHRSAQRTVGASTVTDGWQDFSLLNAAKDDRAARTHRPAANPLASLVLAV